MSDAISALPGAVHDGWVKVTETGLQGMITLRADPGSAAVKQAVTGAAGTDVPGQRGIVASGDRAVAWMSSDELLIMVPYPEVAGVLAALEEALRGEHFLAVNVSDARAVFDLHGAGLREVVAKLCPVDMAPGAFEPGEIRRTRMAQIPAAIWMTGAESLRVVCFRSVAQYAFDLLRDAAAPGGEVGVFA
ncbi:sarcosine oxidase subunit gamma [Roseovarius sp. SYSU LYC5161]|uniref:sarcosine oxidase subunit gamma n=1 Tax=Roseovarius halophilus (ex Wu et al. 2025) TaxID=3376060 RepID=UPI00287267E8|nr:sarcosine oxidase subunit gamma family protein [Roseovarius sp.]